MSPLPVREPGAHLGLLCSMPREPHLRFNSVCQEEACGVEVARSVYVSSDLSRLQMVNVVSSGGP